LIDLA
jgi:hypothetical protein